MVRTRNTKNNISEYLSDELLCAVAISDKYEYFALIDSKTHEPKYIGRCEIGNSIGELVAEYKFKSEDPINDISVYLDDLNNRVNEYSIDDLIENMRDQYFMACNPSRDDDMRLQPYLNLMLSFCYADLINIGIKYKKESKAGNKNITELKEYSVLKSDIKELKEAKETAIKVMSNLLSQTGKNFKITEDMSYNLSFNGMWSTDYNLYRFSDEPVLYNWFIPKTISSLVNYVISHYISHNIHFKKCAYCGRYFALTDGYKAEYCKRNIEELGYGKTCRLNGKALAHGKKVKNDPVRGVYTRSYQAHYARLKRKQMTNEDFDAWTKQAQNMRDKCLEGLISLQELKNWLNQDKLRNTAN